MAVTDWLLIARSREVIHVHGTKCDAQKMPSSFSRTAAVAAERGVFDKLDEWYPPGSKKRLPPKSGGRCVWEDVHLM